MWYRLFIVLGVCLVLPYGSAIAEQADTAVRLDRQNLHMSRIVIVSTDAGITYKPVWAGIKEGVIDHPNDHYNFFCTQVKRTSRYGKALAVSVVSANARVTTMLSRVHDLGQVNADAAAGMQIAIWELEEDTDIDLSGGNFRARPTIAVTWWATRFLEEAVKAPYYDTRAYVVSHPIHQSMLVLNYVPAPYIAGAGKGKGTPLPYGAIPDSAGRGNQPTYYVPSPDTALLVLIGLGIMVFLRR